MLIVFLLSPFEGIDMIDEIDVTSFMCVGLYDDVGLGLWHEKSNNKFYVLIPTLRAV